MVGVREALPFISSGPEPANLFGTATRPVLEGGPNWKTSEQGLSRRPHYV